MPARSFAVDYVGSNRLRHGGAQGLGGFRIGREEGLQRQFRQGDVDGRAEHRRGRKETQQPLIGAQLQRHEDFFLHGDPGRRLRFRNRVSAQFLEER